MGAMKGKLLNKKRTIAVLSHQGIGDILMSVPLLRNCDANLSPEDHMIVLVRSRLEVEVLNSVPWRSNVEVWTAERGDAKNNLKLVQTAFTLRSKHPSVFLAPLIVDRLRNAIWTRLISAPISVGPTGKWSSMAFTRTVQKEPGMHQVDYFIRFGVAAGFPEMSNPDVRLPVSLELQSQARSRMPGWSPEQRWIALGPGSGEAEAFKRWPSTHYQKLAGLLLKHSPHIRIALFGGLGERELLESILHAADFDVSRCFLYAGYSFHTALALLTECYCMVAGCAGLMHMAAAAGVPVVGLYGPSNPGFEGDMVNSTMQYVSVSNVPRAIALALLKAAGNLFVCP